MYLLHVGVLSELQNVNELACSKRDRGGVGVFFFLIKKLRRENAVSNVNAAVMRRTNRVYTTERWIKRVYVRRLMASIVFSTFGRT